MAKSPAFQFYPDDFLGSAKVAAMSPAEIGCYVLLLCYDWNGIGIEFDSRRLSRMCRMTEAEFADAWKVVGSCFVEREGRYYNPRLERERDKQERYRLKQVAAGVASAKARGNHGSTSVQPRFNSPFPSPSPTNGSYAQARNETAPTRPHLPAVALAPQWCPDCGDGVLEERAGSKRGVRVHAAGCSRGD